MNLTWAVGLSINIASLHEKVGFGRLVRGSCTPPKAVLSARAAPLCAVLGQAHYFGLGFFCLVWTVFYVFVVFFDVLRKPEKVQNLNF
jgi:hypothetical protein